jgi:hypothetical protein
LQPGCLHCRTRRFNRDMNLHPLYRVISFERVGAHELQVEFDDDHGRRSSSASCLPASYTDPLRDPGVFGRCLDPEVHTLVWPNGADFDPAHFTIGRSSLTNSAPARGPGSRHRRSASRQCLLGTRLRILHQHGPVGSKDDDWRGLRTKCESDRHSWFKTRWRRSGRSRGKTRPTNCSPCQQEGAARLRFLDP